MTTTTGYLRDSMSGPGEAIELTLAAPDGVNYLSIATKSLSVVITPETGTPVTITSWTFTSTSQSELVALYVPDGTEFDAPTVDIPATIRATLTLDGVAYRFQTLRETIKPL